MKMKTLERGCGQLGCSFSRGWRMGKGVQAFREEVKAKEVDEKGGCHAG